MTSSLPDQVAGSSDRQFTAGMWCPSANFFSLFILVGVVSLSFVILPLASRAGVTEPCTSSVSGSVSGASSGLVSGVLEAPSDTPSAKAEKGKRVLVLSPSPENKRNSEGSFITLRDGKLLFIYTHYGSGGNGDHDSACLKGRISGDGGKTWSEKDQLILENEGAMNIMSVSLLRLRNGSIALFYLRKNSTEDCIPVMRLSANEGESWGPPVECITDRKGYFVLNNDRAIQLSGGRIILPVALHKVPGDPTWNNKAKLFCYYSDDNGQSWAAGNQVPDTTAIITQEPGVIEMKNGQLLMFIRASGGYQQFALSADRGVTWSHIGSLGVASPLSPASIKKIPSTGDWLMVWNNNDGSRPQTKGERTPLTVAVSRDEGKTWPYITDIETDPDGWYCYTAIHFYKRHVLLGYCAGSQQAGTHLDVAAIRRIRVSDLYHVLRKD